MDLNGKISVVTGGGSGIGQAVCLRLARDGARIAILDVAPADETLRRLKEMGADC
jgi:NAD(P)-dependent dehydrogenase (short-subunit alcohol dehydrogenase family)